MSRLEPVGSGVAYSTTVHLTGPYKIENLAASGKIVVTNKVPNAPYRGAGQTTRPSAVTAMLAGAHRPLAGIVKAFLTR